MVHLRQSWWQLTLHAGLFILSLVIVFSCYPVLPLADLPNHLARAYVIHNIDKVPALAEAYRVQWQFTPYFVMEVTLDLLQHVMSIYTASKVFISLCLASIVLGVISINLALRPVLSVTTLLVYPVFFSQVFLSGFLNFTLGTGVALLTYAWWLRSTGRPHRLAVLFVLFNVNFFVHPISYAFLVAMITLYSCFEAGPGTTAIARITTAAKIGALALPQLPFWLLIPHDTLHSNFPFFFGELRDRGVAMLSPFLFAVSTTSLVIVELVLAATYLVCVQFKLIAIDRAHIRLLLALGLLCLVVPAQMLGVAILHIRLPFVTALLLIGVATEAGRGLIWRRALTVGVLMLSLLQLATAYQLLKGCSSEVEELRLALARDVTTPGTPLVAINDVIRGRCESLPFSFANTITLAVIESHSYVPQIFTMIPPVRAAVRYGELEHRGGLAVTTGDEFFNPAWRAADLLFVGWQSKFNYLVWLHFGNKDRAVPPELKPISEGSYFTIFEISSFTPPG